MAVEKTETIVATKGPWKWRRGHRGRWELVAPHHGTLLVMDAVRSGMQMGQIRLSRRTRGDVGGVMVDSDKLPDLPNHPDARLMQQAPAMAILLCLLQSGDAAFDPSTKELRFGGMRYSARDQDWSTIVDMIGWERVERAGA